MSKKRSSTIFTTTHEDVAFVRRIVLNLKKTYGFYKLEIGDLIGYGMVGLLEARSRFDSSRGVRFETYAYRRIRGSVLDGYQNYMGDYVSLDNLHEILEQDHFRFCNKYPNASAFLMSDLTDNESAQDVALVRGLLKTLTNKERRVIIDMYWRNKNGADIGRMYGLHRSWPLRVHHRALKKLREKLGVGDTYAQCDGFQTNEQGVQRTKIRGDFKRDWVPYRKDEPAERAGEYFRA